MNSRAGSTKNLLVFTLNKDSYKRIRHHIRESCGNMAELAAGEVLANALEHGSEAKLSLSIRPKRVELVVSNSTHPLTKKDKTQGMGGRGLSIIQKLTATGAVRRYDCTIQGTMHTTRLVLKREVPLESDSLLILAKTHPRDALQPVTGPPGVRFPRVDPIASPQHSETL